MSAGMIIELKPQINVPDCPPSPARDDYSITSDAKYPSSYEHKFMCSCVNWRTDEHAVSYLRGRHSSLVIILRPCAHSDRGPTPPKKGSEQHPRRADSQHAFSLWGPPAPFLTIAFTTNYGQNIVFLRRSSVTGSGTLDKGAGKAVCRNLKQRILNSYVWFLWLSLNWLYAPEKL